MSGAPEGPSRLVPFTGTVAYLDTPTTDQRMVADHAGPWASGKAPLYQAINPAHSPPFGVLDQPAIGTITVVYRRTDETGRMCLDIADEVEACEFPEDGTLDAAATFVTKTGPVISEDGQRVIYNAMLERVVCGDDTASVFPGTMIRACKAPGKKGLPQWTLQHRRNEWENVVDAEGQPITARSISEARDLHAEYSARNPEEIYRSAR